MRGSEDETNRAIEFGVLGPLTVLRGSDEIRPGSAKQRAVLGILLANRGKVVSTDRLIDEMWSDDSATDRQNALWVHISNVRKSLDPDKANRSGDGVLRTQNPGYLLDTATSRVDADAFEALVAEGRALTDTDPAAASIVYAEALSLWRGRAYADFSYETWAQPEILRLEELRLEAVESRIDADLRTGLAPELVGELQSLVKQHPARERLSGSLMLALNRSGRQAEALRTYQVLRRHLGDELGIEPSPELQRLEEQIVTKDTVISSTGAASISGAKPERGLSIRGYEIRERLGERGSGVIYRAFQPAVGREVAIKIIRPDLADDPYFIQRFGQEAQLVARLEHPHIVPLYDYWREPGAAFLVMRYIDGGTLRDRIAEGPMAADELSRLVDHVGAALETAQLGGVDHGQIEPANILIDGAGNFYLADFRIATGVRSVVPISSSPTPSAGVDAQDGAAVGSTDVADFAVVIAQALTGRTEPLADLLVGLEPHVAAVLQEATLPVGESIIDIASMRREISAALDAEPTSSTPIIDENPYKGLRSFEQSDARDFFGRERFIERLVARLGRAGRQGRFVAVVGPSGSGKSSVVKAGLIPALRSGAAPQSDEWFTIEMTPSLHPFEELEAALLTVAVNPPGSLLELLTAEHGIHRAVARVLPNPDAQLLVVVDQFEELFTQAAPDATARFLDALVEAVDDDRSRVKLVVTLRADFYDRPLRHRGFGELLRTGTEVLTPMSPEELQRATTGPAERVGAECEPALVAEVVAAVLDRPAALPLLQYALTEVFERRSSNVLRADSYHEVGGVSGALVDRAEAIYADLSAEEKEATRLVFLRLVTLGDGANDTSRRVLLSELLSMVESGQHAEHVVETFGRHRLLAFNRDPVTRGPTVEISHEALLSAWGRLERWIDDARADIRAERRLAEATEEWLHNERQPGFLLRDARLARFDGWLENPSVGLTTDERAFLSAGLDAESSRQHEEIQHERREAQYRQRSRFLAVLTVAVAALMVVGGIAILEGRRASDLARELELSTEARQVASEAHLHLDRDAELAVMLAIEAARVTSSQGVVLPEAMDALHAGIQASRVLYPVRSGPVGVRAAVGGGVMLLPPDDLVSFAQTLVGRTFTEDECAMADVTPCGDARDPLPDGLEIAGDVPYMDPDLAQPLAGTRVMIVAPESARDRALFELNFEVFTERTGIEVVVRSGRVGQLPFDTVQNPDNEDIAVIPQPAALRALAPRHALDVSSYIDRSVFENAWSPYLTSLLSVGDDGSWPSSDGGVYGVWNKLDLKSLIWFNVDAFTSAGYAPPRTWDELIELSDEIADAGHAPICMGLEANGNVGWTATDVIESIVLRTEGPEFYDAWLNHDVPFNHPAVVAAAERFGELIFTPGYLPESPAGAALRPFWESVLSLADAEPGCWLLPLASYAPAVVDASAGESIDAFDFPVLNDAHTDAMVGAGTYVSALNDRPEVRAVMEFIASPEYGAATAAGGVGWIPPHSEFNVELISNESERRIADTTIRALKTNTFRFDASDLMPREVGADLFWKAMVDWFNEGPDELDRIMAEVEAGWIEFEQGNA